MTTLRDLDIELTYLGGPAAYLRIGGLTVVTDPPTTGALPAGLEPVDVTLVQNGRRVAFAFADGALASIVVRPDYWTTIEATRADGKSLRITSVPVLGPPGSDVVASGASGFVLSGEAFPSVYVSGDNSSLATFSEVRERCGPMDVALLFAGAARGGSLADERVRLTAENAGEAALLLGRPKTVALNFANAAELRATFEAGGVADLLTVAEHAERVRL